jgi:hypothetical protein
LRLWVKPPDGGHPPTSQSTVNDGRLVKRWFCGTSHARRVIETIRQLSAAGQWLTGGGVLLQPRRAFRRLPQSPAPVHHGLGPGRRIVQDGADVGEAFRHSAHVGRLHPRRTARPLRGDRVAAGATGGASNRQDGLAISPPRRRVRPENPRTFGLESLARRVLLTCCALNPASSKAFVRHPKHIRPVLNSETCGVGGFAL